MKIIKSYFSSFLKNADMVLLAMCVGVTLFGIVAIASATAYTGSSKQILVQSAALLIGIGAYIVFSIIDIDIIASQSRLLYIFSLLFIATLYLWGKSDNTGNSAWLRVPLIGISLQPAEICKIAFIIVLAKSMSIRRDKISSPGSIILFVAELGIIVLLIVDASSDAGSAIVYCAVFVVMALVSGISLGWFLGGAAGLCALMPILWTNFMRDDQKQRILVVVDNTIDPTGAGVRYQMKYTRSALGSGQLFGQGLGKGTLTSTGSIPAQHTDCIIASIGEEMGYVGCIIVLLLLALIVLRCIYVGLKASNYTNRLICIGIAGMLMFQIIINVGMNIGILPVIGLTLPFVSYGGSSIVTTFAAMGIVSGIKMRPESDSTVRYVRPPVNVK